MTRADHVRAIRGALVDVRAVCERLGLVDGPRSFRRQARGAHVRCPKHGGVSCSVTLGPEGTIRVHCFGCDFRGDVLDLIAASRGLDARRDFRRVLVEGAELAGRWDLAGDLEGVSAPKRTAPRQIPRSAPKRTVPLPLDPDGFDRLAASLLEWAPLQAEPDVSRYLAERRLLDLAMEAGWGALPADSRGLVARLAEAFGANALRRAGLAIDRSGRFAFAWEAHRLLIPWRTPGVSGAIQTVQRRLVRPPRLNREPKYVFPASRRPTHPFVVATDIEDLDDAAPIAIVEGAVDALALRWLARRDGRLVLVAGIAGVKDWRPEWARIATGRKVYLALDADRAGDAAIQAIHADLRHAAAVKRWRPKTGKDWAEQLEQARRMDQ